MSTPAPATSMSDSAIQTKIEAARAIAVARAPYLARLLYKLVWREAEPGFDTLGVTVTGILMWGRTFIEKYTPENIAAGLIHETMHVFLEHGKRCGARDHEEWNIAGDRAINPGVRQLGLTLPFGCFPSDIGAPEGLTADEYYQLAQKAKKQGGQGGQGKGQQAQGKGNPGGAKGVCNGKCGGVATGIRCEADSDADARSPEDLASAVEETHAAMSAAKQAGKLPGAWAGFVVDGPKKASKVDWRRQLSTIVRAAMRTVAGATTHRYDQPARKQAGLGFGAGVPVLARTRAVVPNVCVVLDTSGSMISILNDCIGEVAGVLAACGGQRVAFLAADADVAAEVHTSSLREICKNVKGGGGTDFRPAIARAAAMPAAKRPQVLVYITDGYGAFPPAAPRGIKVVWVLVGNQVEMPPWGTTIRVES